jgi:hypothetical protein
VGAINDALAVRDFIYAVDKNCALFLKFLDNEPVVHDLFADVYWWAERL